MGQKISAPIQEGLEVIHTELMKHGGADFDIATATTLTYEQFLLYISQLNRICANFKDANGSILVFAVTKGTDSTIFWKTTVKIACIKFNTNRKKSESYRLLNIRQFLQVFRRITYECSGGKIDSSDDVPARAAASNPTPPTMAASAVFKETLDKPTADPFELDECVICLERKPDVSLPCCHCYCLPCIEQWWEYCEAGLDDFCNVARQMNVRDKSCPVCRESLSSTDDTWVISEAPTDDEVSAEIHKSLMGFATAKGATSLN